MNNYFQNPFNTYMPYQNNFNNPFQQNAPHEEITRVNGREGANAYQMGANSSKLMLDETAPILWLAQTDGAGYKTLSAFDITPHQQPKQIDLSSIEKRIERLEQMYGQSSARQAEPETATKPVANATADSKI